MTDIERQLMSIFAAALDFPAGADRAAYLDAACESDPRLRQRIDALLQAHEKAAVFLEPRDSSLNPAAVADTSNDPFREAPGTVIGPYKLIEPIGEGGMGTVWMAQQTEPVKRVVAIKFIKAGFDSKQFVARFDAERQALALMDHPNIAKVLDAGTTAARPPREAASPSHDRGYLEKPGAAAEAIGRLYFVMELVKGVPITRYCDEHHLTPRQRLELLVPVCQAVQHAHQKGIIHRDLKPSNVLVALYDGRPVPKVIDFGVAKAAGQPLTEQTLVTGFGAIVGTIEYMSPEQAELNQLDIDTRSDIYSLGVLLYELLTGSPPFSRTELERAGMLEMLRVIREQEPSKPSAKLSTADALPTLAANRGTEPAALTRLVRGELDWIVMKALEKDRNRRYETAGGFALDVLRYLSDEPVQACPPTARYRFRKFVRRNRGPVLAASLLLVTLTSGIIGTTWQAFRAEQQRRLAESNASRAESAAGEAKKAKQAAEAREAETEAVLEFVERRILAAARPEGELGGLGYDVSLKRAIEAAVPFVDSSFPNQPIIEARLRRTLAESFGLLGEAKLAEDHAAKAHSLFTNQLGPDHPHALSSMRILANCQSDLGNHIEALALREKALARTRDKLGNDHPDTLACMAHLAISLHALERYAEAIELRKETLAQEQAILGPAHPQTLRSMNNLANSYSTQGRHTDALNLHQQTLQLCRTHFGPDHSATLTSMQNLSNTLHVLGQTSESLEIRQQALSLADAKLGADHPMTLDSMSGLADSYESLGRHADALELRQKTLELRREKLGPLHSHTLRSMCDVASCYQSLDRLDEALELYEETLTLQQSQLGHDHVLTLVTMNCLSGCYLELGRATDAVKLLEQVVSLRTAKLGPDHPDTHGARNNLSNGYEALGRHAEAREIREDVLRLDTARFGNDHIRTLDAMTNLANSYLALGRYSDALPLYEAVVPRYKAKLGADHPQTLASMSNLAEGYSALRRHTDAMRVHTETLTLRQSKLGPDHSHTLMSMHNLASCYTALGRHDDALQLLENVLSKLTSKMGTDHPDTLITMTALANCYEAVRRHEDALALREKTLQLKQVELGPQHPNTLVAMHNKANSLALLGRHEEALELYAKAAELRKTALGAAHPSTLWSMQSAARSLLRLDRAAEGVPIVDECVRLCDGLTTDPELVSAVFDLRLRLFAKLRDADACRTTIEMWEKLSRTDAASLYKTACFRAVTAAVIRANDNSDNAARAADAEADQAMAWLEKAVAAGFTDAARIEKNKDLDSLRDRDDFTKLVHQLTAQQK